MLKDDERGFMRLVLRSPDRGDGWRSVSEMLRKATLEGVARTPELYETREQDGLQIRLSERGNVVKNYI